VRVKVLGSAAGGGFPQWNCACPNCARLRQKKFHGSARTQTQLAISPGKDWFLLDASPDLRLQLESDRDLVPRKSTHKRASPIAGVILTSVDVDRVLGLLHLREFQPFTVYATESLHRILTEDNSLFRVLHREASQVSWKSITPEKSFEIGELRCTPIAIKSGYPDYVSASRAAELAPSEALIGLEIEDASGGKKLAYFPSLPAISDALRFRLAACDLIFLDGTFWQDDELTRLRGAGRGAREMGHVPISGDGGTLEWLGALDKEKPKKVYIHINNTNPILDEESDEHARLTAAGFSLAHDGQEFDL
jgi:pyrroloquinoline quinone biosynthesis protein B